MNKRYLSSLRSCMKQILPPGKIQKIKEYYYPSKNLKSSDKYFKVFNSKITKDELVGKYKNDINLLDEYEKRGLIHTAFDINSNQNINYEYIINLKEKVDYSKIPENAKKQKEIIEYLNKHKDVEYKELLKKTKSNKSSLDSLIKKEFINIKKIEVNKSIKYSVENYKK
ncbi:MAG: hypothetical protein E6706_04145 [Anaerococcus hydrogenalis]|nr:hypothetical protein [Anaerococcus hydrogenalis]